MALKNWMQGKKKWISSSICLFILVSSVYFYNLQQKPAEQAFAFAEAKPAAQTSQETIDEAARRMGEPEAERKTDNAPSAGSISIVVDVKGAVVKPGVYALPRDARVYQAIGMAGGLLPEADAKQVNGAQLLQDGTMLYVPLKGEASAPTTAGSMMNAPAAEEGKINLNTATSEQLQTIPGIGPGKADAILQYREEHGPFKTVDELTGVSGIGAKTVEKMKSKLFVQ
ncbi:comEA protein [Aneurinibacillus aneurinilyticus ATCC 12856]|uniref:ComEA protein n=1 Tax=Aneurinibacillus aneurinilyticus ATCC 12856 TaxID=649747 RepID=U1YAX7_ANEAE|nr:comEA protein [Aneurinibacillus aneurinilyticus ATCC 12856]